MHFGTIMFVTRDKFHEAMKSATPNNARRRQCKKVTLHVLEFYTLTYDSHETPRSLGEYVLRVEKHRSFRRCCC